MEKVLHKIKINLSGFNIARSDLVDLLISIIGFILGKVFVFGYINPIVLAFVAPFLGGKAFNILLFFSLAGILSMNLELVAIKYIIAFVILGIGNHYITKNKLILTVQGKGFCAACAIMIGSLIYFMINRSMLLLFLSGIEALLVFLFSYVLYKGIRILTHPKHIKAVNYEEIVSLAILISAVTIGLSSYVFGHISLTFIACTWFVMIVAYKGGSSLGAIASTLIGFFMYLAGICDISLAIALSLGSIFGGMLRQKGKLSFGTTFCITTVLIYFFVTEEFSNFIPLYSLIIGFCLFMLTPHNFYFNIASTINPMIDNHDEYLIKIQEASTFRLNQYAFAFDKLAGIFRNVPQLGNQTDEDRKIKECRDLFTLQLYDVSVLFEDLSRDIENNMNFKTHYEELIMMNFALNNIKARNIIVTENKNKKLEIRIVTNKRMDQVDLILKYVSTALNRKMKLDSRIIKSKYSTLTLVEENKYNISYGFSFLAKNNVSGDSFTFIEGNDQQYLILSDGMGTGEEAFCESNLCVTMLEHFMKADISLDLAIRVINSALVMRNTNERFTTLDICAVDTFTAESVFTKCGASYSFIVREKDVQVIESRCLPIGVIPELNYSTTKKNLQHNDYVIMLSDGVFEVVDVNYMVDLLKESDFYNPQDLANYLQEKLNEKIDEISDDITILIAKIWENI